MTTAIGIDGARGGWVAIALTDGVFVECRLADTLQDILDTHPDAGAFGIDVPIGLPGPADGGVRAADVAAREMVGARRSSVFPTPPSDVLAKTTYPEANAHSKARYDRGVSAQAYALRGRILEADSLREHPRVYEVHPEVSFCALKGASLTHSKKTWNGLRARIALLEGAGIHLPDDLPCGHVAPDDVVDAAVAAWSARRIAAGGAGALPAETSAHATRSSGGLSVEERVGRIWY